MQKLLLISMSLMVPSLLTLASRADEPPERTRLTLRETAGIRRFGYPATAVVALRKGMLTDIGNARLVDLQSSEPLPNQMTVLSRHPDGSIQNLEIDSVLSPGPLESIDLQLECGTGVSALPSPQGLRLTENDEFFQVSAFRVPKSLHTLVQQVHYGRDYLRTGGLSVAAIEGDVTHSVGHARNVRWTVEKNGPLQVRLRCHGFYPALAGLDELPFELVLEFASTKSWIAITHSVSATAGRTISLESIADFQLGGQLLWDIDAGYWLYGVLESGESLNFEWFPRTWKCELTRSNKTTVYAQSRIDGPVAQRWGHLQQAQTGGNVVAFGVSESAGEKSLTLNVGCDGLTRVRSTFAAPAVNDTVKQKIYFHFVPVPLQDTARTSPAAMMWPLEFTAP